MQYDELLRSLQSAGKDPARLVFEDELTGISNRRFLRNYLEQQVDWSGPGPLSLLMIDLDGFKQVNDTYGHHVGDQVLIWLADRLREVSGDRGIPVRFAGDEFMILMPGRDLGSARQTAERLLERLDADPFRDAASGESRHLRLSIGIAAAPQHARDGDGLIRQADIALYAAKAAGGNRSAVIDEVAHEGVGPRRALNLLQGASITGRSPEFAQIADALLSFEEGRSGLVAVAGAPGMGKTTFLDAIAEQLRGASVGRVIKLRGRTEELFRPYYLTIDLLAALMEASQEAGRAVLDGLSSEELRHASWLLPRLADDLDTREHPEPESDPDRREAIFDVARRMTGAALANTPLVLLIDDLHLADEASLNLLGLMIRAGEVPVLICGTTTDPLQLGRSGERAPLQRFLENHRDHVGLREMRLAPLTPDDVRTHLRFIFPDLRAPASFESDLTEIVQGNPLFLNEIIRKLVIDQRIALVGQQWVIQSLDPDELPRSLEEVVQQKLAALDEGGRELLEEASVFGDAVTLSTLAGSSAKREAEVLEFVDQAARAGFLTSEFELNDESIRFLSHRIVGIVYGGIEAPRREELHERAGSFQEELYEKRLLPSASILAYHFKRSASREKAQRYERALAHENQRVFDADEARSYWTTDDGLDAVSALDATSMEAVPSILRWLLTSVNNVKLYPPESRAIIEAARNLKESLDSVLARNEVLRIDRREDRLALNGESVELPELEVVIASVYALLRDLELAAISFSRGLTQAELVQMLEGLAKSRPEQIDQRFWSTLSRERGIRHIDLLQRLYTEVERRQRSRSPGDSKPKRAPSAGVEGAIDPEERERLVAVLRALLGAFRGVRLYPFKSRAIRSAVDQLYTSLTEALGRRRVLTLAAAGDVLVVDGVRLAGSDVDTLAQHYCEMLASIGLAGLTFFEGVARSELDILMIALGEFRADEGAAFWERIAGEFSLRGVRFHENLYRIQAEAAHQTAIEIAPDETGEQAVEETAEGEPESGETIGEILSAFPHRIREALLEDDSKRVEQILQGLFRDFAGRDALAREQTIDAARTTLQGLDVALSFQLATGLGPELLGVFDDESHPHVLRGLAALLHRLASLSIQLGEYRLATRILIQLRFRQDNLAAARDPQAQVLAGVLDRHLEPAIEKLLLADLESSDAERGQAAARVITCLGRAASPLLMRVLMDVDEPRARSIAASLLGDVARDGGRVLARALAGDATPQQRARLLDVLDQVTRDVGVELALHLADPDPVIRQAALRLADRAKSPKVVEIVQEAALSKEIGTAIDAIGWLGRHKLGNVAEIRSILQGAREPERTVACCQALGQIADPASIPDLRAILEGRRLLSRRHRWSAHVRAAAASALALIPGEETERALALHVDDRDPAVRRIAARACGTD